MCKNYLNSSQENILTSIRCNMNKQELEAFDHYLVLKDNNLAISPHLYRELEDILKKVIQLV